MIDPCPSRFRGDSCGVRRVVLSCRVDAPEKARFEREARLLGLSGAALLEEIVSAYLKSAASTLPVSARGSPTRG